MSDNLRRAFRNIKVPPRTEPVYHVYLIESNGYYKIGYTSNLKSRLSAIQTATPHDVNLAYTIPIPKLSNYDHKDVEISLHLIFENSCVKGEWYQLSMRDIAKIKNLSIEEILDIAEQIQSEKIEAQAKQSKQMRFDF